MAGATYERSRAQLVVGEAAAGYREMRNLDYNDRDLHQSL